MNVSTDTFWMWCFFSSLIVANNFCLSLTETFFYFQNIDRRFLMTFLFFGGVNWLLMSTYLLRIWDQVQKKISCLLCGDFGLWWYCHVLLCWDGNQNVCIVLYSQLAWSIPFVTKYLAILVSTKRILQSVSNKWYLFILSIVDE